MASKEELLKLREEAVDRVERLRRVGDYGAGAADIRAIAEAVVALIDDRLEGKK